MYRSAPYQLLALHHHDEEVAIGEQFAEVEQLVVSVTGGYPDHLLPWLMDGPDTIHDYEAVLDGFDDDEDVIDAYAASDASSIHPSMPGLIPFDHDLFPGPDMSIQLDNSTCDEMEHTDIDMNDDSDSDISYDDANDLYPDEESSIETETECTLIGAFEDTSCSVPPVLCCSCNDSPDEQYGDFPDAQSLDPPPDAFIVVVQIQSAQAMALDAETCAPDDGANGSHDSDSNSEWGTESDAATDGSAAEGSQSSRSVMYETPISDVD